MLARPRQAIGRADARSRTHCTKSRTIPSTPSRPDPMITWCPTFSWFVLTYAADHCAPLTVCHDGCMASRCADLHHRRAVPWPRELLHDAQRSARVQALGVLPGARRLPGAQLITPLRARRALVPLLRSSAHLHAAYRLSLGSVVVLNQLAPSCCMLYVTSTPQLQALVLCCNAMCIGCVVHTHDPLVATTH